VPGACRIPTGSRRIFRVDQGGSGKEPTIEVRWMPGHSKLLIPVLLAASLSGACATTPTPTVQPTATTAPTLIPPDSDSPAAGICGLMEGDWVRFTVSLDVPSPRCAQVRPGQRLEIANSTGDPVVVTFAGRDHPIQSGASLRIDEPFGSYLASGVHFIYVTEGTGNLPELWLLPE